jgi:CRISPR-associated protein Cas2
MVLVLTACPEGLRGHLTRWLLEVSAGVFVGHVSRRVEDELWQRTTELVGSGRAVMASSAPNEQHFTIRNHGHHWTPEDFEGVILMRRPADAATADGSAPTGWSSAARRRTGRFRK